MFFFFKQKTAYEMRISDWSSDVCSSDLRLQPRDRSQRAGAAHLYVDCVQHRLRAFRREFVRDRPTRGLGDLAEPLLPVQPVHLVDDAVDVERQIGPPPLDTAIMIDDLLQRGEDLQIVADRQAP